MLKAIKRFVRRIKLAYVRAWLLVTSTGGNWRAIRELQGSRGVVSIDTIIYIFVAIVILYQLIPTVSGVNTTVQGSANVSTMGKFAAGLGEWLFPLFGLLALVFMLWTKRSSKGGT